MAVVTFDCWQTLLNERDRGVSQAIRIRCLHDVARTVRPELGEESAATAFERATWRQFEAWHVAAHAGAADVARWSLEALAIAPTEVDELVPELERVFSEAVLECRVDPLPGSLETLVALRRAGVPKALVCDTGLSPGRVVRELLARCGLLGELDALVFSDEVGVAKPDARIFERALRVFGAEPSEATHVGDLLRTDVAGARELGMRTVRIRAAHDDPSDLPEADHVAEDHDHLREILGLS